MKHPFRQKRSTAVFTGILYSLIHYKVKAITEETSFLKVFNSYVYGVFIVDNVKLTISKEKIFINFTFKLTFYLLNSLFRFRFLKLCFLFKILFLEIYGGYVNELQN